MATTQLTLVRRLACLLRTAVPAKHCAASVPVIRYVSEGQGTHVSCVVVPAATR